MRITAELKTQPSYHGGLGEFSKYLWFHLPETNKCEILGTKHGSGKGWEDYTEYEFKVRYTKNNITIWINGTEIFNVEGDFKDGKFGFTTIPGKHCIRKCQVYRYCPLKTELIALNKTCKICWTLIELNKG